MASNWLAGASVVASHESTWTATRVVFRKASSALALALYHWVRFLRTAPVESNSTLHKPVMGNRRHHLEISWPVVGFNLVLMVDLFTLSQAPAQFSFRNQTVFVDIAASVSKMVTRHTQNHIAIRGDRSAALPVWIPFSAMNDAHGIQSSTIATHFPRSKS